MASSSLAESSNSVETAVKSSTLTSPTRPSDQLAASVSGSLHSSPLSEDPFSIAASQQTFAINPNTHAAFSSNSASLEPLFGASSAAPTSFGSTATGDAMFGSSSFAPSFSASPAMFAPASVSNPFVAPAQPVMVLPQPAWPSPAGSQGLSALLDELCDTTLVSSLLCKPFVMHSFVLYPVVIVALMD